MYLQSTIEQLTEPLYNELNLMSPLASTSNFHPNENENLNDSNNLQAGNDNNSYHEFKNENIDQKIQYLLDGKVSYDKLAVEATILLSGIFRNMLKNIIRGGSSGKYLNIN